LQIGYTDSSSDLIIIQNFDAAGGKMERFELSTGNYMTDTDMNQIIADMSTYAATNSVSYQSGQCQACLLSSMVASIAKNRQIP
jgi:hypothetical protein